MVSESLFMTDGTPVLLGCFRHMRDENAEWCAVDNFFTFDTPLGEEYCRIIDHEAIRKKQDFNSRKVTA